MARLSRRLPIGAAIVIVVLLAAVIGGALALGDESRDLVTDTFGPSVTERMELRGQWLGMRLTAPDSSAAGELGVPSSSDGVVVAEIPDLNGSRVRRAGLVPGDIIVGVNGSSVGDLADLYDATAQLDVAGPVSLDIERFGQPMTLVLPPLYGSPQTFDEQRGAFAMPQQQPFPAQQGDWVPVQFICPADRSMWMQHQVHPHYRCPHCTGPLSRTR